MEGADLISSLPDALLADIVSLLPVAEGVRTSVLSQRWKTVWKHSSRLNFDQKQMLKPLIERYLRYRNPNQHFASALRRKVASGDEKAMDAIAEASMLINSVIDAHCSPLKSCLEVLELKDYILKTSPSVDTPQILKNLTFNNVGMSPEDLQGILSCCSSLENLTLEKCNLIQKVVEIDTITCYPEMLVLKTPKLHVLCSYHDSKNALFGNKLLTTKEIIETCSGIASPQGSHIGNIFENLVTLCIDLDLKKVRNAIALFFALKSCRHLENLEINNQVNDDSENHNVEAYYQNEDDCLPFPKLLFWQRRELCECINHQLKTLHIKGFTGKEFEVEFVKYIITNAEAMERITVWFADVCFWEEVIATVCLLSYPKASANLSIILKPGTKYLERVGGGFEEWLSTLRL
ncbi:F-box-like domain superfamily [Sesbania bispinosa]|nr:F-box-like domain superfamily [Sesbania bispinosa]